MTDVHDRDGREPEQEQPETAGAEERFPEEASAAEPAAALADAAEPAGEGDSSHVDMGPDEDPIAAEEDVDGAVTGESDGSVDATAEAASTDSQGEAEDTDSDDHSHVAGDADADGEADADEAVHEDAADDAVDVDDDAQGTDAADDAQATDADDEDTSAHDTPSAADDEVEADDADDAEHASAAVDAEESVASAADGPAASAAADSADAPATTGPIPAAGPRGPRRRRKPVGSTAAKRMRRSAEADRRRRAVVTALNRTVGTIAGLGIIGATVWALGWMPLPSVSIEPDASTIRPAAGEQVRVCAGSLLQMGLTNVAGEVSLVGDAQLETRSSGGDAAVELIADRGAAVVTVPGDGSGEVAATGAQSLAVGGERTRGFSATPCIQPAPMQWLMAGATTIGHTLVLDVVNPGAAPARVNFSVVSNSGTVAPGIPEMVLEPGTRKQVSLVGVVPNAEAVAVRVTATGSPVAAFLHETITSTLDPVGFEVVAPTALPATTQVLPGLWVAERAGHEHAEGEDASTPDAGALPDRGTVIRLLNPGEAPAATEMRVLDAQGAVVAEYAFDLASRRVADVVLSGLPEGEYTVRLDADAPLLASARIGPVEPTEYAWLAAPSPLLGGTEQIVVPVGGSARLALANPTEEAVTVTIDGEAVTIAPGATANRAVAQGAVAQGAVVVEGAAGLVGALHWNAQGAQGGIPVLSGSTDSEAVTVYP